MLLRWPGREPKISLVDLDHGSKVVIIYLNFMEGSLYQVSNLNAAGEEELQSTWQVVMIQRGAEFVRNGL